ncbi:hypothetical protein D7V83_19750 [bacterium 0.1xD8-71]|nr:hypothetical protein D7V83_19750 [bacterium 0.1xD8-71]
MGNYFPTFQVISLIRPPGLPAEIADRRIWRMKAIVRRLAFVLFGIQFHQNNLRTVIEQLCAGIVYFLCLYANWFF